MSNGDKRIGSRCATGEVEGTGSDLRLVCGFRPAVVMIHNVDGEAILFWNKSLPDTYGWKQLGVSSGTNAAEAAHTHAVALDSGSSAAVSHTHADSLAVNSGTVTVTPNAVTAGTPSGTITGQLDLATPAFSGTGYATAGQDITTTDNQTMAAVTTAAGMWFIADGLASSPPVLILSNTIVAGAPAVLTCQGVPPVTDGGTYKIVTVGAATFVGDVLGTHQHADTAVLADVTLSGEVTAEAAHVHGPGSLADAASAAGSSHNHVFTGGAGENALITSLGITPYFDGFNIGADTDVNVSAETIYWSAWRY